MRLLALLVLALALAVPAAAQDNGTVNETPTNDTPVANETPVGNETAGNTTGGEPAAPAAPPPITIELEGYATGGFHFKKAGESARNPTITVQPGQKVTFVFRSVDGVHNLNINGEVKTEVVGPDAGPQTIEWTAPETPGALQYWCDPHKGSGMVGRIQVGSSAPSGGGETEEIEGPTVDLSQYDENCAGKVAPASAANGEVGMPTLDDYIAKLCTSGEGDGATQAVDPYKSADYVIPLSWLLIGVGVVGVVWVHKYYKP